MIVSICKYQIRKGILPIDCVASFTMLVGNWSLHEEKRSSSKKTISFCFKIYKEGAYFTPLRRMAQPNDMAGVISFLAGVAANS